LASFIVARGPSKTGHARWTTTKPKKAPSKETRFLKKATRKLFEIAAGGVGSETPQTQIKKSFLLLFYKKAGLPSLKSNLCSTAP
jgi:hypothetical protein